MDYQGKIGFRIFDLKKTISAEIIKKFLQTSSPDVGDATGRLRSQGGFISLIPGAKVAGRAITVFNSPADNLMVHKALELVLPGDLLIISSCGNRTHSCWGGLLTRTAKKVGLAAVIVDGSVRDIDEIRELGLPVFARAISSGSCFKDGPGEINCPIALGHTVVEAGDLVVADDDGITVVRYDDIDKALTLTEKKVAAEAKRKEEIEGGELFKNEINATLKEKGVLQ